jgi:hypothetical protein
MRTFNLTGLTPLRPNLTKRNSPPSSTRHGNFAFEARGSAVSFGALVTPALSTGLGRILLIPQGCHCAKGPLRRLRESGLSACAGLYAALRETSLVSPKTPKLSLTLCVPILPVRLAIRGRRSRECWRSHTTRTAKPQGEPQNLPVAHRRYAPACPRRTGRGLTARRPPVTGLRCAPPRTPHRHRPRRAWPTGAS